MENIVFAFDVDGVMLDYVLGFRNWLLKNNYFVGCEANEVRNWSLNDLLPKQNSEEIFSLIRQFSLDEDFSKIPEINGAYEGIVTLKKKYPDNKFIAVTSAGNSEITINNRKKNLSKFELDEVHVVDLGESKFEYLSRLPNGSVFVDDLKKNINVAEEAGLKTIFYRQLYNENDTHQNSAYNWKDVLYFIDRLVAEDYIYSAL